MVLKGQTFIMRLCGVGIWSHLIETTLCKTTLTFLIFASFWIMWLLVGSQVWCETVWWVVRKLIISLWAQPSCFYSNEIYIYHLNHLKFETFKMCCWNTAERMFVSVVCLLQMKFDKLHNLHLSTCFENVLLKHCWKDVGTLKRKDKQYCSQRFWVFFKSFLQFFKTFFFFFFYNVKLSNTASSFTACISDLNIGIISSHTFSSCLNTVFKLLLLFTIKFMEEC